VPVLSGEEQDPGRRRAIFCVGQTSQRVLLLLPETRAGVRSNRRCRRSRCPSCQGPAIAVRGPSEPRHTHRRWSTVVGRRRVEIVQLGHASGPAARGRPPSDAKDHAQGAGPSFGVRRTTAVESQAAQDWWRKRTDKTLKIVVQPFADS